MSIRRENRFSGPAAGAHLRDSAGRGPKLLPCASAAGRWSVRVFIAVIIDFVVIIRRGDDINNRVQLVLQILIFLLQLVDLVC